MAVATLVKVMNDPAAAPSAMVTAAAVLLRFGREGVELDDPAARLDDLERQAGPRRVVASRAVEPADEDEGTDVEDVT